MGACAFLFSSILSAGPSGLALGLGSRVSPPHARVARVGGDGDGGGGEGSGGSGAGGGEWVCGDWAVVCA